MVRKRTRFELVLYSRSWLLMADVWCIERMDGVPEWDRDNPEDVAEALESSIDKWDFTEIAMDDPRLKGKAFWCGGTETCGLCELFNRGPDGCFIGCPVMQATGVSGCAHTPFYDFHDEYRAGTPESAAVVARREGDFLRSLREKS